MTEVIVSSAGNLKQLIKAGTHTFFADEPLEAGGEDSGPDPYTLLLGALGACTSMTLQLYARRKGWRLEKVEVHLRHTRMYAADCANCAQEERKLEVIERQIQLTGELSGEQRARLLDIAQRCPVHKTLSSATTILDVPHEDQR